MTGREEPSKRDLEANMHKRMYLPATGPGSRKPQSKRFNRHGIVDVDVAPAHDLKAKKGKGVKGKGYVPFRRYQCICLMLIRLWLLVLPPPPVQVQAQVPPPLPLPQQQLEHPATQVPASHRPM